MMAAATAATWRTNAADFHSMLPMYRVKFLYAEMLST